MIGLLSALLAAGFLNNSIEPEARWALDYQYLAGRNVAVMEPSLAQDSEKVGVFKISENVEPIHSARVGQLCDFIVAKPESQQRRVLGSTPIRVCFNSYPTEIVADFEIASGWLPAEIDDFMTQREPPEKAGSEPPVVNARMKSHYGIQGFIFPVGTVRLDSWVERIKCAKSAFRSARFFSIARIACGFDMLANCQPSADPGSRYLGALAP